jgi:hypothetical protein
LIWALSSPDLIEVAATCEVHHCIGGVYGETGAVKLWAIDVDQTAVQRSTLFIVVVCCTSCARAAGGVLWMEK